MGDLMYLISPPRGTGRPAGGTWTHRTPGSWTAPEQAMGICAPALPAAGRRGQRESVRRRAQEGRRCAAVVPQSDLLLLDELMNHWTWSSCSGLSRHGEVYPGPSCGHRRPVSRTTPPSGILELSTVAMPATPYQGNYSTYLETEAAEVEGAEDAKKRKRLQDELEWLPSSPRARQAKAEPASAASATRNTRPAEAEKNRSSTSRRSRPPRACSWAAWSTKPVPGQGLLRARPVREPRSRACPQRHRRRPRAERRRDTHHVQDDRRRGTAR